MDERHWWLAAKIQESFGIGGYDNPTLLEDFMCQDDTMDAVNNFLSINGQCRIFFYCAKPENTELSVRSLQFTDSLSKLRGINLDKVYILYFLRRDTQKEVDLTHFEKDILSGEIKKNAIEHVTALLGDIYLPALKNQKDWGQCAEENKLSCIHTLERLSLNLAESASSVQAAKQQMLRQPDSIISNDFKQHRLAAADSAIISEYEELVSDWMNTIENILMDSSDERFMDPSAGPMSELERWRRRQRLMTNITEQLKSKECKAVIGVLIQAKSKLLKRWKVIDCGITDAVNETKDKVKYMEGLRRYLDQLYHGATPQAIMQTALPGLVNNIKQMDSISRFYSRSGFLGLFFTKITNQLVLACKEYMQQVTINDEGVDNLWSIVSEEIGSGTDSLSAASDTLYKQMKTHLENKLKGKTTQHGHNRDQAPVLVEETTLFGRMKACLALLSYYKECVHNVRDSLGVGAHTMSHYPSMSSVAADSPVKGDTPPPETERSATPTTPKTAADGTVGADGRKVISRTTGGYSPSKKSSSLTGDSHGVSMSDDDAIIGHFESFSARLKQIMDVMNTMSQYQKLVVTSNGIPRPRPEDFEEEETDEIDYRKLHAQKNKAAEKQQPVQPIPSYQPGGGLNAIQEDMELEEQETQNKKDEEKETSQKYTSLPLQFFTEPKALSEEDVEILRKYYGKGAEGDGPSVSSVIRTHLQKMTEVMNASVTSRTMVDVETADKDRFEETYTQFLGTVSKLERFLCAYLHCLFSKKMKTWQALKLLTQLSPIAQRPGPRPAISEKFIDLFNQYETDLEKVIEIYEAGKDNPPLLRNAPPVAGAIYWARQLLIRIEEPMKVFRDTRAVSSLRDFSRICKMYNRIATALVTFETMWFQSWKSKIEMAKAGMKATLLVHHPNTKEILVNADERVVELFAEGRWMVRQGMSVPDSIHAILQQENRFKAYKDHLQLALTQFYNVVKSIPHHVRGLFQPHVDQALVSFQPGVSTLAWNSMNIDAFLHQVHSSTAKLSALVGVVNEIMANRISSNIENIRSMFLFDYDLAFGQIWTTEDFVKAVQQSVNSRSLLLLEYISNIENGMQEIVSQLLKKKGKGGAMDSREEDKLINDLLNDYGTKVYEALLTATKRSLLTLAEASGCDISVSAHAGSGDSAKALPDTKELPDKPERPLSALSTLSDMSWNDDACQEVTYLQFKLAVKYDVPNTIIDPSLEVVKAAVNSVAQQMLKAVRGVKWASDNVGDKFYERIMTDGLVKETLAALADMVEDLAPIVRQHIHHFSMYDFLWKDDLNANYLEFMKSDPGIGTIEREVERLLRIETQILRIPKNLIVGPIILDTSPITNALHGFSVAWKARYADVLHEEAKKKLDSAILYRLNVRNRLELDVGTLDQLNSSLFLLEEVRDMENKIDSIYLPIESLYSKLRLYEVRIPRVEVEEVDSLRVRWEELLELADSVREDLLKEKRNAFEQELDKQVKTFVVEVIQFRNAFDAQGPSVPGISPEEAVSRLHDFQQKYKLYDAKRKTLDSVSKLFGIKCKPFPELDKTGEELDLLGQLYGLFQKFIRFDKRFRDTLWAEVDLDNTNKEVESFWDECLALPSKLKDWDAYHDLKLAIQKYLDVFPLLHRLAAKEIRNRHWLQVMSATGSSFQLEANVFKMHHLLDIDLIAHKEEIEEICHAASKEMELEVKMRITEEEWTEQVLAFEHYKKLGPIYLDKAFTERLLEQLEDAQALLASMLTSKYIGPLREEAASWAEKLKEVEDVLEIWLEVQDLWQYLEEVFSNPTASKELPQEAKKFGRIDKGWVKMMKRAYDTRNVLQCCYGGEVPKGIVLRHIYEELETCFKSLASYLDGKRKAFPRFYMVSDAVLLAILSRPKDLESVRPYFRCLFSAINDIKVEKSGFGELGEDGGSPFTLSPDGTTREGTADSPTRRGTPKQGHRGHSPFDREAAVQTPVKVDKRLTEVHNISVHHQGAAINLPSEFQAVENIAFDAYAVCSSDGERLRLNHEVSLEDGVEVWLSRLKVEVEETLRTMLTQIIEDVNNSQAMEDMVFKYPSQICRMAMLYYWTKECESGITELRYERRAIQNTKARFQANIAKIPTALARNSFRNLEEQMMPLHRLRLETLFTQSFYLRDMLDVMGTRKIRETTDFDWRRNPRLYYQEVEDEKMAPVIYILENKFSYGCEFYGNQVGIAMTSITERCFLTMSQALSSSHGVILQGPQAVGKTETVKGFGVLFSNFISVLHCDMNMSPHSLGKLMQGVPLDGYWVCFDEVHLMRREAMAVLLQCASTLFNALKISRETVEINGDEFLMKKTSLAMFMTLNPEALTRLELPNDTRALFRVVTLATPDFSMLLRAKCAALGLKSPAILGTRLKIVRDLAADLLSKDSKAFLNLNILTAVLKRSVMKRKNMRGDTVDRQSTTMEKNRSETVDKKVTLEESRSNSQASGALNSAGSVISPGPGTRQDRYGGNKFKGTPNPLTSYARIEHALVGQSLLEIIGPRLQGEDLSLFKTIIKDVFSSLPVPPEPKTASARAKNVDIEAAIESQAAEKGLVPHKPWMEKCLQLYAVSTVCQGVILVGPSGSGKSACVQSLIEALCLNPRGMSRQSQSQSKVTGAQQADANHRLLKINPCVVDDYQTMFGYLNQQSDWVDGIFTHTFRKANRNVSTTWISMDGPLTATWADNLNSVLDSDRMLHLKNGDKLALSESVKFLFETDDLAAASPSTLCRCGIVYMDRDVLGWRPIAKSWLEDRTHQEVHLVLRKYNQVLQKAFNKTVDPVSQFVINEAKPKVRLSEVGMFQSCLRLLSAMLADNVEIGGEAHIERLYLFCLMWTFGGLLDKADRKGFSDLLKSLSTALPDDDRDICVFDYYVDESGEWDPWQSRVPEVGYSDSLNMLGDVFVDTVETIRTRILMEFASQSGQNILLIGPYGSGKTSMINDFISTQDAMTAIHKRLVFSGASTSKQLQQFIELNVFHRQGFVYGAKEGKKFRLFVDDINLPKPDGDGVQRVNELLRQLMDDKVLCTTEKPFEWKTIEDLNILSSVNMSDDLLSHGDVLSPRLLRHFAVLSLAAPEGEGLKNVVHCVLEAHMTQNDSPGLIIDLHNAIVHASCRLLQLVQKTLRACDMPGREYYAFSLRDINNCFMNLKRLVEEDRCEENTVISLWRYEMSRIIRDQLCRSADLNWFDATLDKLVKDTWQVESETLTQTFLTFNTDARSHQRVGIVDRQKFNKVVLQPMADMKLVYNCLNTLLIRHNEELGNVKLDIMLSDHIIHHIIKLHRILTLHHSGSMLLIGSVGCHLTTLCRLALYLADIDIFKLDTSKTNGFLDGLRSAIRVTGAEGKVVSVMLTARELVDPMFLDAINSLLVSGEYAHIFSNDELDGLLQAIHPAMKRDFPTGNTDAMKYFVSRVQSNLHIIICLPPNHSLLKQASVCYPGLLSGCQTLWLCDWSSEFLMSEASHFITKYNLATDETISTSVTNCLANIHSYILRDCKQTVWAGDQAAEVQMVQVSINERKKEQIKYKQLKVPNLPYSKMILLEQIRNRHKKMDEPARNNVFAGPMTFRRFLHSFRHTYSEMSEKRATNLSTYKKVLSALDTTRSDCEKMKDEHKDVMVKYYNVVDETSTILKKLTHKATTLEKLKAKIGQATALSAFLQMNDLSSDEEDDDSLLAPEERDKYDVAFEKMREQKMRSRQVKAIEELATAKKKVEECRIKLGYAKEQVVIWKGKVDRQCIERVRSFTNPSLLVVQVMEMVMVLIGKRMSFGRDNQNKSTHVSDETSGRISASSSSTRFTKKTVASKRELPDKFDRQQWKIMQLAMTDSIKFVDMLHNVPWEDGLPNDTRDAVEGYLAKNKDGAYGITGEGSLLDNAADTKFQAVRRTPSPDNTRGITIAAAKFSSEDAAVLVQYTIAIVEYTRLCVPLKAALEKQHKLEREIEENERIAKEKANKAEEPEDREATPEPEPELDEEDLPRIEAELKVLQDEYDKSVVEKHKLSTELKSMHERMKAANDVLNSLTNQELQWRAYVENNKSESLLYSHCIVASAYLVYAGAFNIDTRKRLGEFFVNICQHHGLPLPEEVLFRKLQLFDYLYTKLEKQKLELLRLPMTPLMLENAAIIMQEDNYRAWPLICDPTSRSVQWVKCYIPTVTAVKYHELRSHLDTCLSDGTPLLVTDCDTQVLLSDKRFLSVLASRARFVATNSPFKLMVGDHEVECNPSFRLYLHTAAESHEIPAAIATYVLMIYFHMTRSDIEEELLHRFMAKEKSRVDEEKMGLLQEYSDNAAQLTDLEAKMKNCLSSNVRLMQDLPAIKKLAELKKQYEETIESQQRVEQGLLSIERAREGFRSIALRGAIIFNVNQYMTEVNPLYVCSMQQFLDVYDAAILHSERASVKAVVERLTYSAYQTMARTLMEKDKMVYTLLAAIEIEDAAGRINLGEREYVISPQFGALTMSAHNPGKAADRRVTEAKKPFDWMTDDQFHNLQLLAQNYEWFMEMFERMSKDGREMAWRNLCEGDLGEAAPLPDKMDEILTSLQRLCIIRAVRPDRIMQASSLLIQSVLGKKFVSDGTIDWPMALTQCRNKTPILLLYNYECEAVEKVFTSLSTKRGIGTVVFNITSADDEPKLRVLLQKTVSAPKWLLLQFGHNASSFLASLESLLLESEPMHPEFRCWVSALADHSLIPTRLLQIAVWVQVDSPKAMKESLVRSFSMVDSEILKSSGRNEWPAMLHNICYVHSAIRLRTRYHSAGFNSPLDLFSVGTRELLESLSVGMAEFKDGMTLSGADGKPVSKSTSWTALRFMLSEIIYGGHISNSYDQQTLNAVVDYWASPLAVKKDFELSRVKYKHPLPFLSAHPRLSLLNQALESLPNHFLDCPEGCHLHTSIENTEAHMKTILGDDMYIFTRLNKVYDAMPATVSHSNKLFPRPPSPFDGPAMASTAPAITPPHVLQQGMFATASYANLRMRKEVELAEIIYYTVPKIPKAYSREYINDRLKKIGGMTPFNLWLVKELEAFFSLINTVKSSLQSIKHAIDVNSLGDTLNSEQLSVADDLYYQRIPELWRRSSGTAAPPPLQSLTTFINDITARATHFERILVLGREKNPAYWLGCFTNPQGLLTLLKQEYIKHSIANDRSGNLENFVYQTEITNRDKDHLRDPPAEGMFVHGIYIWGASWEKTTGELIDAPPRHGCTALPVIHVTCWPLSEKPSMQDPVKVNETYQCPVFPSRLTAREPIFEIDLRHDSIPATRWALRGLSATVRPF